LPVIVLCRRTAYVRHQKDNTLCRVSGSGCLELPDRRTAWTVVICEQFQTVT